MQLTLNLPDSLSQTETFNQSDWLREIAIALFQQERISLSRASKIAEMEMMDFQQLLANRGICVHYDIADLEQDVEHLREVYYLLQRGIKPLIIVKHERSKNLMRDIDSKQIEELPDLKEIVNLHLAGDLSGAEAGYRKLIEAQTKSHVVYGNLGSIYLNTGRVKEATPLLYQALQLKPDYPLGYYNLGLALQELGKIEESIATLNLALKFKPDYAEAYYNMGMVHKKQSRIDEAEEVLRKALLLEPGHGKALAQYIHCCAQLFSLESAKTYIRHIYSLLEVNSLKSFETWSLLCLEDASPQQQKKGAFQYAQSALNLNYIEPIPLLKKQPNHSKIRLGYLSADFSDHPVLYLMADVLQKYSRREFEVYCYCIRKNPSGQLREKVVQTVDKFVELSPLTDSEAAQQIASDEIDILVNLTGYTSNARTGIVARRPAPVIVNWLGYAGTLGHPLLADYLIGDPIVTPLENAQDFSEHLALMPHCYMPTQYRPLEDAPSRSEAGLPEQGLVFCSFNQSLKISPSCFDVWCRILEAVPDSFLWLPKFHLVTQKNIAEAAVAKGINPSRIIFAERTASREEHLARLSLADLALDTFPYNSHSTGADVLWAGVPLVTLIGETFAGRVGASLVTAVGLPELGTDNFESYYELARELALDKKTLGELKAKLWEKRTTEPLFHSKQFIADLERLYKRMWENYSSDRFEHIV